MTTMWLPTVEPHVMLQDLPLPLAIVVQWCDGDLKCKKRESDKEDYIDFRQICLSCDRVYPYQANLPDKILFEMN